MLLKQHASILPPSFQQLKKGQFTVKSYLLTHHVCLSNIMELGGTIAQKATQKSHLKDQIRVPFCAVI